MLYISTRGQATPINFKEAVLTGLATDGGLYLPEVLPKLSLEEIRNLNGLSYVDLSLRIMRKFIGPELPDTTLRDIIQGSYGSFGIDDFCPTKQFDKNQYLLELFHGPTLAFKDFAMQFIGNLFKFYLKAENKKLTIVTATSGDTGAAAVHAFKGKEEVELFVLFPQGRVSNLQRLQMTTVTHSNVHPIAIEGDFDDCQRMVKTLFADSQFKSRVRLSAVNSINWARILAQVIYFFKSVLDLNLSEGEINFSVPTGNFGDVYAGYITKKMGLPIHKLLIATNANDILKRTMDTGLYETRDVVPTVAPSMDIQISSNFERLLFDLCERKASDVCSMMSELSNNNAFKLSRNRLEGFKKDFYSSSGTDEQIKEEISYFYKNYHTIICPHTAAGIIGARKFITDKPETKVITLATAHPSKFRDTIGEVLGIEVDVPTRLEKVLGLDEKYDYLPAKTDLLKQFILAKAQY